MSDNPNTSETPTSTPIAFKAETRTLLNILIHSLYTEREIFLRELISNASDALTRVDFEVLTNRDVLDPEAELAIRVVPDKDAGTLTIHDTGIGMTSDELVENLGTIAHSGARAFIEAAEKGDRNLSDIIGQFGVGFYSAFMVAEWIRVDTRSFRPDAEPATWFSDGSDTYRIEAGSREQRGTSVVVKLKEDAQEFLEENRLRSTIKRHSDFVAYPIYIGDSEEQVNRQTALWRRQPHTVKDDEYNEFYKQLTLDFEDPLAHAHMVVDAPVQMYAVLYVPTNPERNIFSARKEDGLKLYSRKVLIQEYSKDLLPEYFNFFQGVVDSEDLPLNVSRETVQASRIMANLKKLVTSKALDTLTSLAKDKPEEYERFWKIYSRYIKQGVAIEQDKPEDLYPLLRFHTTKFMDRWSSLNDYVGRMKPDQKKIYYIIGDDDRSVTYSPHLDVVRHYDYEVLAMTDPIDAFMLVRLNEYEGFEVVNVANADLKLPEKVSDTQASDSGEEAEGESLQNLIERVKSVLGERVADVRTTDRLSQSPARLVDPEDAPNQEMQRVYRMLERDYEIPKKVLELNPGHKIVRRLSEIPEENELSRALIEQLYENALLIEGLHPDPAGMIKRLHKIMEAALE